MSLQDRVSAAIANIYDAAVDQGEWTAALRQISDLLAGTRATLKLQSAADVRLIADTVSTNGREDYRSYYRHIEPVLISMNHGPPGVYNSRRIIPKRELFRSEFYNDWGRCHDVAFCIQALMFREAGWVAILAVSRDATKDEFQGEQERLLEQLFPHLERALRFAMRLVAAESRASLTAEVLDRWSSGAFVVDRRGRILLRNRAGENLLAAADGIHCHGGRLCAATPSQTAKLHTVIGRATESIASPIESACMLLSRPSLRRALSVEVVPCTKSYCRVTGASPTALVIIVDPELGATKLEKQLQMLYDLTKAEAAITQAISKGGGIKAAARTLNIAPSTARTHLRHAFEKTGTGRQAELARLVAASCRAGG